MDPGPGPLARIPSLTWARARAPGHCGKPPPKGDPFVFGSRDPFKKNRAEILCKSAVESRLID